MQKTNFEKEAIDLEHRKLLSEYNAILIAMASVTLGIAGLIFTLTKSTDFSLLSFIFAYFVLGDLRTDKSNKLNSKVSELRKL